ncbi:hypothetical protein DSUL_100199 [Desulfovibrionales bacterium]
MGLFLDYYQGSRCFVEFGHYVVSLGMMLIMGFTDESIMLLPICRIAI